MRPDLRENIRLGALGALAASPTIFLLRGFTVDDAWIPARYAFHLASGAGYRFNVPGLVSDGVTPLPWAPLLALLGGASIERAWSVARGLGVLCWMVAAASLAIATARAPGPRLRWLALLPLPLSAPLAAWSIAGLETGLVTLLCALASVASPAGACAAAGVAAAFRPELIVLAFAVALGAASTSSRRWPLFLALALAPWGLVVAARLLFFGRPVPLSVLAKPSDLTHGGAYVVAGLLLGGAPILALPGPGALVARGWIAPLGAALAHAVAVALAGGDWMPLSRLLVPSLPLWMMAAVRLAPTWSRPGAWARALLAAAGMLFVWWRVGPAASSVAPTRASLIAQARPLLAARGAVATLDIGWVGASTQARVVDLAGLTEPAFAVLPGGHTSKRVSSAMLADRRVDTLLFLRQSGCEGPCVRADGGPFERTVEQRLAADPWVSERFHLAGEIRAGSLVYVLLLQDLEARAVPP